MHKSLSNVTVKNAGEGTVSAVFATLDVIDSDGDVTLPGAFKNGQEVVISAYGHTSWGGALPVGKGVINEVKNEAILDGQFFLDTAGGLETFTVVKSLAEAGLGEWSYGYEVKEAVEGELDGRDVIFLKSLDVFEVSPTLRGAGVDTRTLSAKGLKFGEEGDLVLVQINSYLKRAQEVVALRSAKGKPLMGAETIALTRAIESKFAELRELFDTKADIPAEVPEDITAEWLKFLQFQNGA